MLITRNSFRTVAQRMAVLAPVGILATNFVEYHFGADALYRQIFARTVGCAADGPCDLEITIPALLVEDAVQLLLFASILGLFGLYCYLRSRLHAQNARSHSQKGR